MKNFKTLDDIDVRGKNILLRVDINSAIINGRIELSDRLIEHAKTIKELIRKKARVVVLAHQGRRGEKDFTSLRQHARLLNRFVKIKFIDDIIGKKAIDAIKNLKHGQALLLENVRYLKEEEDNSEYNRFVDTLSPHFDYYVNDAFSVSHRNQASITGFPRRLPGLIGRVMEGEINGADKIKLGKPLFVLGGAKPSEQIDLIKSKKNAIVLTAGLFGQICCVAKGINLGSQNKFLEKKGIKVDEELRNLIKNYKIYTPIDFAVNAIGKRKELSLEEFPSKYEIFDIGKKTIEIYANMIRKARVILMKGPPGSYEDKRFRTGTKAILNALVKSKAYTIIAGGNTLSAIKNLNINKDRIDHISLAGGAFIEYLAGKKLPGLEALKRSF